MADTQQTSRKVPSGKWLGQPEGTLAKTDPGGIELPWAVSTGCLKPATPCQSICACGQTLSANEIGPKAGNGVEKSAAHAREGLGFT